jgi:hypothetical protein
LISLLSTAQEPRQAQVPGSKSSTFALVSFDGDFLLTPIGTNQEIHAWLKMISWKAAFEGFPNPDQPAIPVIKQATRNDAPAFRVSLEANLI